MVVAMIWALQWQSARSHKSIALDTVPEMKNKTSNWLKHVETPVGNLTSAKSRTTCCKFTFFGGSYFRLEIKNSSSNNTAFFSGYEWHRFLPAASAARPQRSPNETHPAGTAPRTFWAGWVPSIGPRGSPASAWPNGQLKKLKPIAEPQHLFPKSDFIS